MDFKSFNYHVEAEVTFTKEEYLTLIALAKLHYDATCIEAGLKRDEYHKKLGSLARGNGFLALLEIFPTTDEYTTVIWPTRNFDITMKILEQRSMIALGSPDEERQRQRAICDKVAADISKVWGSINREYKRLMPERFAFLRG